MQLQIHERHDTSQEPEVKPSVLELSVYANEYPSRKKNLHFRSEYTHIHGCR